MIYYVQEEIVGCIFGLCIVVNVIVFQVDVMFVVVGVICNGLVNGIFNQIVVICGIVLFIYFVDGGVFGLILINFIVGLYIVVVMDVGGF